MKKLFKFIFFFSIFVFFINSFIVLNLRWVNPPTTSFILIKAHSQNFQPYNLSKNWVLFEELSPSVIRTFVMGEDPQFFNHKGYYLIEMWKSFKENLKTNKALGKSTITQQTAKNLFLFPKRSYFRKIMELQFAIWMELFLSKERILEIYVNTIEFGRGIFGIEKAAQVYFNKSAKTLSFDESCLLAGIMPLPEKITDLKSAQTCVRVLYRASILYKMLYHQAMKDENYLRKCPCFNVL